jgi:hypothetical protein
MDSREILLEILEELRAIRDLMERGKGARPTDEDRYREGVAALNDKRCNAGTFTIEGK